LYLYPDNFPMKILDLMENDRRFLPYFDIPFQHGSAGILSAMNRHGTSESYLAMIETIRSRLPSAVIRTTFLVGFPGETERDFAALVDFQEKLRPDWLGCFAYSREEGTASYGMKGRVSKKTAGERKREIELRQVAITERNMERFVGQTLDVLLEENIPGEAGRDDFWLGRLYCHAPEVDGAAVVAGETGDAAKAGAVLPCKVAAGRGFDLEVGLNFAG
jgi:ribosomal protein S12 methylthiotransferase